MYSELPGQPANAPAGLPGEYAPATTLLDRMPEAIASVLEAHGVGDDFVADEGAEHDARDVPDRPDQ